MQPTEPEVSVKVFISYAHADQELRKKLEEHLSSLKRSEKISIWQDQEIPPGEDWENQINVHLNEADLILLLISSSFIASNYCWSKEVQTALQRHKARTARVIPVILKPALWQDTPLGQLQALPTGAKPVTQWNDQDAALENVAQGIRGVVDILRSSMLSLVSPTRTKEQWIETGNEHNRARRYTEAMDAFEQAIRLDPNFARAYNGKGVTLNALKGYQEALIAFEQAIRLDPNLASAYHNKGVTLNDLERYQEALIAFEQAIRLDPNPASAYANKGVALNALKGYQEALTAFEQAIRLDPNFAFAYHNKGVTLNNLERYKEALTAFEQAIRLDPNLARAYYIKGVAFQRLGRQTEAQQAYEKARQLGYNP